MKHGLTNHRIDNENKLLYLNFVDENNYPIYLVLDFDEILKVNLAVIEYFTQEG